MPYKKGESGNREGRPKGITTDQLFCNNLLAKNKRVIFQKALELALAGNERMLGIFLERVLPAKPKETLANLGIFPDGCAERNKKILAAVTTGVISIDAAVRLHDFIKHCDETEGVFHFAP